MDVVYLLEHFDEDAADDEQPYYIGVYSTDLSARRAVERLAGLPEFTSRAGDFLISRMVLNEDSWVSGFFTYDYEVE
ncbi:hypothetical protein [Nocardia sp. NPDC046763]|uniref:hypothetical protein n=1 Tax=Nocardia sp. NPDC046763 TaxID=3155256 RepID=UPI0033F55B97